MRPILIFLFLSSIVLSGCAFTDAQGADDGEAVVREFFTALASQNEEALTDLLAEDITFTQPYALKPTRFVGREATMSFFNRIIATFEPIRFGEINIIPTADGQTFTLQFEGDFTIAETGEPYQNTYVSVVKIVDGRITNIVEYFNPLVLIEAFNLPYPQN